MLSTRHSLIRSGRRKAVEDGGNSVSEDVSFAEPVSCVFVISLKMKWMQDRARNGDPLMKRLFLESWLLSSLLIVDKLQIGAT